MRTKEYISEKNRQYYTKNSQKIRERAKEKWKNSIRTEEDKKKAAERQRKYRNKNKEYYWKLAGYPEPTRPEPSKCECCGTLPAVGRSLHLDHCHVTNRFRGWLCLNCNQGLGKLGDNLEGLLKAVEYLKKNGSS